MPFLHVYMLICAVQAGLTIAILASLTVVICLTLCFIVCHVSMCLSLVSLAFASFRYLSLYTWAMLVHAPIAAGWFRLALHAFTLEHAMFVHAYCWLAWLRWLLLYFSIPTCCHVYSPQGSVSLLMHILCHSHFLLLILYMYTLLWFAVWVTQWSDSFPYWFVRFGYINWLGSVVLCTIGGCLFRHTLPQSCVQGFHNVASSLMNCQ